MKILLIDNSLDHTGASKALVQTIAQMPTEFQFIFLFPKNSKCVEALRSNGYRAYAANFIEISKRPFDLLTYLPRLAINTLKLRALVKKEKISVVHVNDIYNMSGLALKLLSHVKVVTHVRRMPESFPSSIYRTWSRLHVKYANRIIAVSEANKNGLPPNNKTTVVYDPLPEEEKLPFYTLRQQLNKQVNLLYLANYTNGKGHGYALNIIEKAIKEFPDWQFSLHYYGGDFGMEKNALYKQSLMKISEEKKISEVVFFNNKTTNSEAVMKSADLILNLSDSESFSRVTLEALFYGIPIIATNVGGTNEMVIEGETGLLATAFDADDMYRAFKKMIGSDEQRCAMAATARQFVRKQFSNENTVGKLMNIYRELNRNNE